MSGRRQVVVGCDGSEGSLLALDWALEHAVERGGGISLVSAVVDVPGEGLLDSSIQQELRRSGEVVREAMRRCEAVGISARSEVSVHAAGRALVKASRSASLVVMGGAASSRMGGVLTGSVSKYVTQHASIPVVVVRPPLRDSNLVVAGVDGSPLSEEVLGFALDVASFRGWDVLALHASHAPGSWKSFKELASGTETERMESEERLLAELTAGWREKYPDVNLDTEIVRAEARDALVAASGRAALVVVGAHGRAVPWDALGSVSQAVLRASRCPVAVLR